MCVLIYLHTFKCSAFLSTMHITHTHTYIYSRYICILFMYPHICRCLLPCTALWKQYCALSAWPLWTGFQCLPCIFKQKDSLIWLHNQKLALADFCFWHLFFLDRELGLGYHLFQAPQWCLWLQWYLQGILQQACITAGLCFKLKRQTAQSRCYSILCRKLLGQQD